MEKVGYNCVDSLVNKFEDNGVSVTLVQENKRENSWIDVWAEYLIKSIDFQTTDEKSNAHQTIFAVLDAMQQGDSCLPISATQAQGLRSLVAFAEKEQLAPFIFDGTAIYLYRYYALEQRFAHQVTRLWHQQPIFFETAPYTNLLQDPHQQQALQMVGEHALNIITGGPGTGKTYTLARVIAGLHHALPTLKIAMAAPTGKAAQRMQEALQDAFTDPNLIDNMLVTPYLKRLTPMTLHRLLGIGRNGRAQFNTQRPLPYDVIVVDEASMLDLQLATLLLEAVPKTSRLILLGDAQQLTSVDVGSVLADLQSIEMLKKNRVHLQTSRRFSGQAKIGQLAKFIQQDYTNKSDLEILESFEQKITPETKIKKIHINNIQVDDIQFNYLSKKMNLSEIDEVRALLWEGFHRYQHAILQYLEQKDEIANILSAFDEYRILTAMRFGELGVMHLNRYMEKQLLTAIQFHTQKVGDWYVGRPVMMTENDYQLGLSNGDIGICLWDRQTKGQYEVYFASLDKWVVATRLPKHIQTAFALTIHKSQGSEFAHTAVVLEAQAEKLLSKELLYTAITRAKKVVTLFADRQALVRSLKVQTTRQSGLIRKIKLTSEIL